MADIFDQINPGGSTVAEEPSGTGDIFAQVNPAGDAPSEGLAERAGKQLYNRGIADVGKGVMKGGVFGRGVQAYFARKLQQEAEKAGKKLSFVEAYQMLGEARDKKLDEVVPTFDVSPADTLGEKIVDTGAGLTAMLAHLALLKKAMPTAPAPVLWEIQNEATGGVPGEGAAMAGILHGVNKLPVGPLAKVGIESTLFGGLAAAEGGETEDIAINAAVPVVLGGRRAVRDSKAIKELTKTSDRLQQAIDRDAQRAEALKAAQAVGSPQETPTQAEPKPEAPAQEPKAPEAPGYEPSPDKMSARQADIQAHREYQDLPEVKPEGARSWQEASDLARKEGIQDQATGMAKNLINNPRPISDIETAGLVDKAIELENRLDALEPKVAAEADPYKLEALKLEAADVQAQYDALTTAIHYAGSEKGRALAAQKLTKSREFKLVSVVARAKTAKGKPLTEQERTVFADAVKELETTAKATDEAQVKVNESEARKELFGKPVPDSIRYRDMTEAEKDAELTELLTKKRSPRNLAKIAINLATRPGVKELDDVIVKMRKVIPDVDRGQVIDALAGKERQRQQTANELALLLRAIRREAKQLNSQWDPGMRKAIRDLLNHLENGTLPAKQTKPEPGSRDSYAVQETRRVRDQLVKELANSEPARAKRLQEQIDYLEQRIREADFGPKEKPEKLPESEAVQRLQYRKAKLQADIRERIAKMKPQTRWDKFMEPFRFTQSMRAAQDFSAVLRQGGWMTITHPIRSFRALPDMFRAAVSEEKAWRINEDIKSRTNGYRYWRSKLEFTNPEGPLTEREENYRSTFAERIPIVGRGVKGSNRAFATFLNRVRADAFDAMTDAFTARDRTLTQVEENAIADFINITTGRGAIRSQQFRAAVDAMNGLLWSPRYVTSRFQLLAGTALYGGSNATRKMIAGEYARFLMGMMFVYTLGTWAGGEIETDPRSSDFGKIRFGNTRADPLSGISQSAAFLSRVLSGEAKRASGEIVPLRGEGVPYGGDKVPDVVWRFLRTKFAPGPASVLEMASQETIVGEPLTWGQTVTNAVVPMSFVDVYQAMREQGVPAGTALGLLAVLGAGMQTYEPKTTSSRKKARGYL